MIQNTTCDDGECSSVNASLWTNTLTYGFGYRCDSQNETTCDPQFSNSNYFKQFSENSLNQPAEPIITSYVNSSNNKTKITFKVNIAPITKTVGYNNSITYIAIPNF